MVSAKLVVHIWVSSDSCGEMSAPQVEGEIRVYSYCCTELLPADSHLKQDSYTAKSDTCLLPDPQQVTVIVA